MFITLSKLFITLFHFANVTHHDKNRHFVDFSDQIFPPKNISYSKQDK